MVNFNTVKFIFKEFLPKAACHLAKNYAKVATQGIDDRSYRPVNLTHFIPCTPFASDGYSLKDRLNADKYLEDVLIRHKCLALLVATPPIQVVGILISVINRICKLITLAHFWYPSENEYSLSERAWTFGKDMLRVAFSPAIYVGMILSSIYGLVFTNNGRKLYATFERCIYGDALLAPCFQPDPTHHFGGTSMDEQGW
jgi:hypothetical protein